MSQQDSQLYDVSDSGGLPLVTFPIFADAPVGAWVTTRHGGVSQGQFESLNMGLHVGDKVDSVIENRRRVAQAIGTDLQDFVFCQQVHLPNVTVVGREHRGSGALANEGAIQATDALVTVEPGLILAVLIADCVPVILFDPHARVLACVHAGWGGTVKGVATATVAAMQRLGADPGQTLAALGPAIDPERYQVGADVADAAAERFGRRIDDVLKPDGNGKWVFNLWRANRIQLESSGLRPSNIAQADLPTGPGTDFFSHRLDGPCGRVAAIARLN